MASDRLLSAITFLLAGFGFYLLLINRFVINWVESVFKVFTMVSLLFLLTIGPFAFGYKTGFSNWLVLPVFIFAVIVVGEIRRARLRKLFQGDDPVSVENHGLSLDRPVTTFKLATLRYSVKVPGFDMDRFRVVHISDLHINRILPKDYLVRVMSEATEQNPDAFVITGDFISKKRDVELLADILSLAHAKFGVYAILGNHDHWCAPEGVKKQIRNAGINLLSDQCHFVGDEKSVLICGCEGPWGPKLSLPEHPSPRPLTLALTHTPDNIYRLSEKGIDAVFAGHYHAGQLRLPYLGPLVVPSIFGRRFDHGHFKMNGTHLFVSAGVGASRPTFRLYCQPDIMVVDFVKEG